MYVAVAEENGVAARRLGGTLQNDILKEYQAQKEYIFPPRPSMRLVTDMIRFCAAEMPRWHPVSISGYHIREAGSTAAQELAFTARQRLRLRRGGDAAPASTSTSSRRACRFFFNAHIDFFEEIAKYRAARRIWARWLRERYGAKNERSMQLRFHTQTAGVSLTAQQPEVNIGPRRHRGAGRRARRHAEPAHRRLSTRRSPCPPRRRPASPCAPSRSSPTRPASPLVADPLGGSYYVEWMTDEMERQAEAVFAHLDELGDGSILEGVLRGHRERLVPGRDRRGRLPARAQGQQRPPDRRRRQPLHRGATTTRRRSSRIGPEVEERQLKRLDEVKHGRDQAALDARAGRGRPPPLARADANLMPAILDAVRVYATVGRDRRRARRRSSAAGPRTRSSRSHAVDDLLPVLRCRVPGGCRRVLRLPRAARDAVRSGRHRDPSRGITRRADRRHADEGDEVVYDLGDWGDRRPQPARAAADRRAASVIGGRSAPTSSSAKPTPTRSKRLLDEIEGAGAVPPLPAIDDEADDGDDEANYAVMSDLFVAADRLQNDPADAAVGGRLLPRVRRGRGDAAAVRHRPSGVATGAGAGGVAGVGDGVRRRRRRHRARRVGPARAARPVRVARRGHARRARDPPLAPRRADAPRRAGRAVAAREPAAGSGRPAARRHRRRQGPDPRCRLARRARRADQPARAGAEASRSPGCATASRPTSSASTAAATVCSASASALEFDLDDHAHDLPQVLGAVYAASKLPPRVRADGVPVAVARAAMGGRQRHAR